MKFEDYWAGEDKDPIRIELKPETTIHQDNVSTQRKKTFLAKIGAKEN